MAPAAGAGSRKEGQIVSGRRALPNPSIERTSKSLLRKLSAAAHLQRCTSLPVCAQRHSLVRAA
jgi:hypothetical protein